VSKKIAWSTLCLVLLLSFVSRVWRLHIPETYIFDEVYHGVTAKLIAQNDPRAFEWWHSAPEPDTAIDWLHPPIAKYFQALSIAFLGASSFSWRISSVVFGVATIWMVYLLAMRLWSKRNLAVIASLVTATSGLLLVQSRITMNDIHVTFFILLTTLLGWSYLQKNKTWLLYATGVAAGLAIATKWSGVFILGYLGLIFGIRQLTVWWRSKEIPFSQLIHLFAALIVVPIGIYIGSYSVMFTQGKTLWCNQQQAIQTKCYPIYNGDREIVRYGSHFEELHRQIWWYQTHLDATHPYQSQPWQWFLNLKPVWFHVNYDHYPEKNANIYAVGNPVLQVGIVVTILVTLGHLGFAVKSQKLNVKKYIPIWFLLGAYAITWLPWMISPRILFYYHYTPAIPFACLLFGFWLSQLWDTQRLVLKWLVIIILINCMGGFLLWYPHWTALPVPTEFVNQVYFGLPSWK